MRKSLSEERDGWIVDTLLFLVGLIPKAGLGYLEIITNKRGYKKRKAKIGSLCLFVTYIYFCL